jgi:hypothetical protein
MKFYGLTFQDIFDEESHKSNKIYEDIFYPSRNTSMISSEELKSTGVLEWKKKISNLKKIKDEKNYTKKIESQKIRVTKEGSFPLKLRERVLLIEDKMRLQLDNKRFLKDIGHSYSYLKISEIQTLQNFYETSEEELHIISKKGWKKGMRSPYDVHYKFFIDQIAAIIFGNSIVDIYDLNLLGYLIRPKGNIGDSNYVLSVDLSKMKNTRCFDRMFVTETKIDMIFGTSWYLINQKYSSKPQLLKDKQSFLEKVCNRHRKLFGHTSDFNMYRHIRNSLVKITELLYWDSTQFRPSKQYNYPIRLFLRDVGIFPELHSLKVGKEVKINTYKDYFKKIFKYIQGKVHPDTKEKIKHISKVLIETISVFNKSQDKFKEFYGQKGNLLKKIYNCPYTNILKKVDSIRYISFLLFGYFPLNSKENPHYKNYISQIFLKTESSTPGSINSLDFRISTLTLKDFEIVGLENQIDQKSLDKFKDYCSMEIQKYRNIYHAYNHDVISFTYQTSELMKERYDMILKIWKAGAYFMNNHFIDYSNIFKELGFSEGNNLFNKKITYGEIFYPRELNKITNGLHNFIEDELKNKNPNQKKLHAYSQAIKAVKKYWYIDRKARQKWYEDPKNKLNWFDNLFIGSNFMIGYSKGFSSSNSYKSWLIIMKIFNLFGTDIMTGFSIPNEAFDSKDRSNLFAPHHINPDNKISIKLSDIILTWGDFHVIFESFSNLNSQLKIKMLEIKLRKLIEIGLNKDRSDVKQYPDEEVNQWITKNDFFKIFHLSKKYKVEYQEKIHEGSLYYLWSKVFSEKSSFNQKIKDLNKKIETFKIAENNGFNGYFKLIKKHYKSVGLRFLNNARKFTQNVYEMVINGNIPTSDHKFQDIASIGDAFLMKVAFEID